MSLGMRMLAVPDCVDLVAQPEIGPEVNYLYVPFIKLAHDLRRRSVGQGEEDDVYIFGEGFRIEGF